MKFLKMLFFLFFYNVIGSCHFKKILRVPKNYLVNLKKDMQQINLTKLSIKNFASLHPFVSAKIVHEGLGILSYIFLPSIYCIDNECKKSKIHHLSQHSKNYFFLFYKHFFNFIFKFGDEYHNESNFFSSSHFKKEDFMSHCTRFIPFPILTSLTKMYALCRTKPTKKMIDKESSDYVDRVSENYGKTLQKLFTN